ncbi:MAG: hypothetical protein AABX77_00145 [Nanoarchaeota archaeon]
MIKKRGKNILSEKKSILIVLFTFLLAVLLFENVFAEEINFIYPQKVIVGQEFNVTLILVNFSQDIYDVKLDVKNKSNYISKRFWGDEWRKNRWIDNAINLSEKNNETFKLNITENYSGLNNISIKIRNSDEVFEYYYILNITNPNEYNISQNNNSQNTLDNNGQIYYNLSWEREDIINGKEFKIIVNAFNLEDKKYDVKIWIESNGNTINERYYNEWKSGRYYINDFFSGPGNKSEKIKIRINEVNRNFTGEADLLFRIREERMISYKINISNYNNENNETKENNEQSSENSEENKEANETQTASITANVIRLGNEEYLNPKIKDIKKQSFVYESESETMKKYAVYGFAVLCLVICILIIWRKT